MSRSRDALATIQLLDLGQPPWLIVATAATPSGQQAFWVLAARPSNTVGEWLKGLSPSTVANPPSSGQCNVVNRMVKVHLELEGEVAEVFWALCRTSWPVARSALDGFPSLGTWEGQLCIGCGMR